MVPRNISLHLGARGRLSFAFTEIISWDQFSTKPDQLDKLPDKSLSNRLII